MTNAPAIKLWDPLIRLCHWSLAGAFLINYFFTEGGSTLHEVLGYYAAAWVILRFVWGFVGPEPARWRDFWPSRQRLRAHAQALLRGQPYHRLGHSPIGALVMILMLLCLFCQGITGFLMEEVDYFWGDETLEAIHTYLPDILMALVCVHVSAAIVESIRLRDNLPRSMITGMRKPLD